MWLFSNRTVNEGATIASVIVISVAFIHYTTGLPYCAIPGALAIMFQELIR